MGSLFLLGRSHLPQRSGWWELLLPLGARGQAGLPVQLSAFGFRDFLIVCSVVSKAKPIGVENTQIS